MCKIKASYHLSVGGANSVRYQLGEYNTVEEVKKAFRPIAWDYINKFGTRKEEIILHLDPVRGGEDNV